MAKALAFAFCLFCILRVSSCSLRLPKISVLNSLSILPIYALLTDPVVDLFALIREGSLGPFPVVYFPLERWIHSSAMSLSGS